MPSRHLFDTNILPYACDREAGEKRETARQLVEEAFHQPAQTSLSVQVPQEFFVNFTRKNLKEEDVARFADDFSCCQTIPNTHELFLSGLEVKARWKLSLWDAMIVAAAQKSRSTILYTEDLNHGQHYGSAQARNPFHPETADL